MNEQMGSAARLTEMLAFGAVVTAGLIGAHSASVNNIKQADVLAPINQQPAVLRQISNKDILQKYSANDPLKGNVLNKYNFAD